MNPKISVIIPLFNVENYIESCVNSLFSQSLSDLEFIFVNDCSTDDSLNMLKKTVALYGEQRNKVKIINHECNKGVATARNSGLAHATAEYIGWVDADDLIDKQMFELMYDKISKENADIIWCDFYNSYEDREDYIQQAHSEFPHQCVKGLVRGRMAGVLMNKLIRKSLFIDNNIRFPDGLNMCEDLRVSVQLFYYAERVAYLNQAFYHYSKKRTESLSASNTLNPKINSQWIENVKGIVSFIENNTVLELQKDLMFAKLVAKQNLLIKGKNIEAYKIWLNVFPEANRYIWKTSLPFYYKGIAWFASNKLWLPIWFALKMKNYFSKS
ncbi:glycosyltransferase family 2 protein [Sphingobacterium kitahiroshimense]|uniref:Glycosyltransferase n=1 Tax=Sphingobacterium kitahiroshimense TaxID=470446 RepID=A0ABV0BVU8_9SPHI